MRRGEEEVELNKVYNMDCIEYMKTLPDESVDLIIADPPANKIVKDKWDNQWENEDDYVEWALNVIIECERILKKTGTLYLYK